MTVLDLLEIVVVIFVFSMSVFIGFNIMLEYDEAIQEFDFPETALNVTDRALDAFAVFDYMFIFVVGGLMIAAIIGAFLIPTHPIFLVLSIVAFVIVLLIVPQVANVFLEFTISSDLNASVADQYGSMIALWNVMPLIVMVFGAILIIVIYSKIRSPRVAA